ncbi:MAG: hypothetical protein ABJE95_26535 [Byssovorax sp.]
MKSATDRALRVAVGEAPPGLTPESIAAVKDFTARKTLEQAYAFTTGLVDALDTAPREGGPPPLAQALAGAGISRADAEQIAGEGVALIAVMAERDRRAEALQAASRTASESERALYDRLASFARLLRMNLGPSSPALPSFGVPVAEGFESPRPRARSTRPLAQGSLLPK